MPSPPAGTVFRKCCQGRIFYQFNFFIFSIIFHFFNLLVMNIYVANLHYRLNDEDLHQIFSEFGEVTSAKIIKDHETGRSRGFGFVEMPNQEEGSKAMNSLNGTEIEGKQLMVNEARPKQPNNNFRSGGGGGNRGGGGYGGGGRDRRY